MSDKPKVVEWPHLTKSFAEMKPNPLNSEHLQELFSAAIDGAIAFGFQGENRPPEGHWLRKFWEHGYEARGYALSTTPALEEAAKDATGRTPKDYAIEHAEYMATAGQQLLEAINELEGLRLRREESDDVDDDALEAAGEGLSDAMSGMRQMIYEFRKRRDRALRNKADGKEEG